MTRSHRNNSRERDLELVLTENGRAELVDLTDEDDGEIIWTSDSDEDFMEEFPDFLTEKDVEPIQEWLIAQRIITDDEAESLEISEASLSERPRPNDDEDDDEDDDGDDDEDEDEEELRI